MFTGIVQGLGSVKDVENSIESGKIVIETDLDTSDISIGDSICVDGVCLTVTVVKKNVFEADLSDETLRISTLGSAGRGALVNLENSLLFGGKLGGHLVTGHIDGLGIIAKSEAAGKGRVLSIEADSELLNAVVKKGSVAVDGISLTVADVFDKGFSVFIIPHTLKETTLQRKVKGDKVNIETDIIGKYVCRFLLPYNGRGDKKSRVNKDFLLEHGFITEKNDDIY